MVYTKLSDTSSVCTQGTLERSPGTEFWAYEQLVEEWLIRTGRAFAGDVKLKMKDVCNHQITYIHLDQSW